MLESFMNSGIRLFIEVDDGKIVEIDGDEVVEFMKDPKAFKDGLFHLRPHWVKEKGYGGFTISKK